MATLIKILTLVFGSLTLTAYADEPAISFADNWSQVSQLSRDAKIPIMMIFTAADCGYCMKLKQEVVLPMLGRGDFRERALVREFDIDAGGKITDFDGERVRRRIFVNRYEVFATPTVVIVDEQGEGLIAPLVGFNQADSYVPRLHKNLDDAKTALNVLRDPNLARIPHQADRFQ